MASSVVSYRGPRRSRVVYVVVRLRVAEEDYFLLLGHHKWGDWSLVGGHVEPNEADDWTRAAEREVQEELEPLRVGKDFTLERVLGAPERWGPVPSRSAGGELTQYEAEWFCLRFLVSPAECLSRLLTDDYVLVARKLATDDPESVNVASLLQRLDEGLRGGLDDVPLAWPDSIEASERVRLLGASASAELLEA